MADTDEEEYRSIITGIQSKIRRLERQRTAIVDAAAQKCAPLEAELAAIKDDLQRDLERMDAEKDRLDAELDEEVRLYQESSDDVKNESTNEANNLDQDEDLDPLGILGENSTSANDYDHVSDGSFVPSDGETTRPGRRGLPTPLSQSHSQSPDKVTPKAPHVPPPGSLMPYAMISESHPTVIRSANNDCWVEVRCYLCGVNAKSSGSKFFRGVHGLMGHVKNMHLNSAPDKERWHFTDTAQACIFKTLSDQEAQGILAGQADAYHVPIVRKTTSENHAWKESNDPASLIKKRKTPSGKSETTTLDITELYEEDSTHTPSQPKRFMAARKSAPIGGTPRPRRADSMEESDSES